MESDFSDTSVSWAKPSLPQASSFSARLSQITRQTSHPSATSSTNFNVLARFIRTISSRSLSSFSLQQGGRGTQRKRLGEGATYVVTEQLAVDIAPEDEPSYDDAVDFLQRDYTLVAVKATKVTVPKNLRNFAMSSEEVQRLRAILTELQILSTPGISKHENIASLLGLSWYETAAGYVPSLIMELATLGNCRRFTAGQTLSDDEKMSVCRDVSCGLNQLHAFKIVHGDVKQDNVLIYPTKGANVGFVAKIADFERSPETTSGAYRYTGTKAYNAPELHFTVPPKADQLWRCDIYSFGLFCLEMMSGASRYQDIPGGHELRNEVEDAASVGSCDVLDVAMRLVQKCPGISQKVLDICLRILSITLHRDPKRRVPQGWADIHNLLERAQPFIVLDWGQEIQDERVALVNSGPEFSLLELCDVVPTFGKGILGPAVWADLEYISANSPLPERGRALFNLFLCYSTRNHTPVETAQEAFECLASSAESQYGPAFVTGKRAFQANGLRVPEILLSGPKDPEIGQLVWELEKLPDEKFYCEAVRRLWPLKLQKDVQNSLAPLGDESWAPNSLEWIREQRLCMGQDDFRSFAHRNLLLHRAVASGNYEACKLLLEHGCVVDSIGSGFGSTLHLAFRCADTEMIFTLLRYARDVDWFDDSMRNTSPLHWLILLPEDQMKPIAELVVACNHSDSVDALFNSSADEYFDDLGLCLNGTPLVWATECRNLAAVEVLIDLGRDIIGTHTGGVYTCLELSIQLACPELAEYFLQRVVWEENSIDIAKQRQELTKQICHGRKVGEFSRWLMHGGSYERKFGEMLDLLERYDCRLLRHSKEDGKVYATPLFRAVMTFNFYLVKELLRRGADPNDTGHKTGWTPLEMALSQSYDASVCLTEPVIALLLQYGASTRPRGGSPLRWACDHGVSAKVLQTVLNADPDQLNISHIGATPLLRFVLHNNDDDEDPERLAQLQILVEAGANLHAEAETTPCSPTPLAICLWYLDWRAAEYLLSRGAPVQFGVTRGKVHTILHLLTWRSFCTPKSDIGDSEKVLFMIRRVLGHETAKRQNLINVPNWNGSTPLRTAAFCGLHRIVAIFLEKTTCISKEAVRELYPHICHLSRPEVDTLPRFDPDEFCSPDSQALKRASPFVSEEYRARMSQIKTIFESFMEL